MQLARAVGGQDHDRRALARVDRPQLGDRDRKSRQNSSRNASNSSSARSISSISSTTGSLGLERLEQRAAQQEAPREQLALVDARPRRRAAAAAGAGSPSRRARGGGRCPRGTAGGSAARRSRPPAPRATSVLPTPASPSSSSGCSSATARKTASGQRAVGEVALPAERLADRVDGDVAARRSARQAAAGLLQRAAREHPRQVALVVRRGVEVGRRVGALGGVLGRARRSCSASSGWPRSASSTAVARSGIEPMCVSADAHVLARAVARLLDQRADADHRPVLGAAGELLVAEPQPSSAGTRTSVTTSPCSTAVVEVVLEQVGRRDLALRRRRPRASPSPRRPAAPPGGRRPGRRGPASRRSCPRLRTCWSAIVRRRLATRARGPRAPAGRRGGSSRRSASCPFSRCDAAQARHLAQVHEQRRRRQPQLHQRQQRVPAGQQLGVLAALGAARPSASSSDVGRDVVELGGITADASLAPPGSPPRPASGVSGMSMYVTPSGRSASITALVDRRRGGDRARLADALDAERVDRRRRLGAVGLEARQLRGAWAARSRRTCRSRAGRPRRRGPARRAPGRCAWTMPPWTWPSISIGLIAGPQSSTAT